MQLMSYVWVKRRVRALVCNFSFRKCNVKATFNLKFPFVVTCPTKWPSISNDFLYIKHVISINTIAWKKRANIRKKKHYSIDFQFTYSYWNEHLKTIFLYCTEIITIHIHSHFTYVYVRNSTPTPTYAENTNTLHYPCHCLNENLAENNKYLMIKFLYADNAIPMLI